jgi:serine/threonine protein kinase
MASTVAEYCGLLARSGLFTPEQVRALRQRWNAVARDPEDVGRLATWLVHKGHLTEYQATLVQRGQVDHFFLGRYQVLERIGKGRMAGVFRCAGPDGRPVAVKVLPPSRAREPQLLARFQREARLATQLNHPSIVRTLEFGSKGDIHYLVMEYLDGDTLEVLLEECGRLSPKEAVRLAFLTCLGLQHLHECGLVHRDLKPANLMLCPMPPPEENTLRSMVKILDIGLGREVFDPDSREVKDVLTNDGAFLGTPDFMAPEQARDPRRADIRSDLYSIGCILYRMLAGEPPFPDDNLVRQILRHATQQPRPLSEVNPAVPEGLNRIVLTLLAKDPGQRYQTPAQAAEALRENLATGSGKAQPR